MITTYVPWKQCYFNPEFRHLNLTLFYYSFVRSINMDKWKELELEKMQVGGNRKAKEFFISQPDFRSDWTLQEKYNSRAAALLRDKVPLPNYLLAPTVLIFSRQLQISTEAAGKQWSEETSSARDFRPFLPHVHTTSELLHGAQHSKFNYSAQAIAKNSATGEPNNMHTTYSDLEMWLRDSDDVSGRRHSSCSSRKESSDWANSSQGAGNSLGPSHSSGSISQSNTSWQSGWAMVSQMASVAARRTTELASQATQKTKQLGHVVHDKVKDTNILDTLSKGVDTVASKSSYLGSNSRQEDVQIGLEPSETDNPADLSSLYGSTSESSRNTHPQVNTVPHLTENEDEGWSWIDERPSSVKSPVTNPSLRQPTTEDSNDGWAWDGANESFHEANGVTARRLNPSLRQPTTEDSNDGWAWDGANESFHEANGVTARRLSTHGRTRKNS
ncbi:hypothetical protein AHF37_02164 [Paragonimus kellicotti]|nr:hypothetical protein AHF37_02164 [Paragonimus kellicotti]